MLKMGFSLEEARAMSEAAAEGFLTAYEALMKGKDDSADRTYKVLKDRK